jgi:phenylacetate-CoA ligase
VRWPAIPPKVGAAMLAMQYQLARSQWWPADAIERQQLRQLSALLAHASDTVPFYRQLLAHAGYSARAPLTAACFFSLPLLRRADVQQAYDALQSIRIPADHGRRLDGYTSGSTGTPLRFCGTEVTHFFWGALTLRDHLWHKRELERKSAVIRASVADGPTAGWGASTEVAYQTGPGAALNIRANIDRQLRWLQREQPGYLLTHPSNLRALARRSLEQGIRLPGLLAARTFGEVVDGDLRALSQDAWGVPLIDVYSAEEVGYIALQCPEHAHYHVQAESVLVEILDERGQSCPPGKIGRVVVTTMHNFAMPLIRYELGDYAEVGEPCACGRGLPVLKRIMGRQRNMVRLPDGTQHWPFFSLAQWGFQLPVRQLQMLQHALDHIEVRLVCERALEASEVRLLTDAVQRGLGYPFNITVTRVDAIPRSTNCKYEDFVCRVPD